MRARSGVFSSTNATRAGAGRVESGDAAALPTAWDTPSNRWRAGSAASPLERVVRLDDVGPVGFAPRALQDVGRMADAEGQPAVHPAHARMAAVHPQDPVGRERSRLQQNHRGLRRAFSSAARIRRSVSSRVSPRTAGVYGNELPVTHPRELEERRKVFGSHEHDAVGAEPFEEAADGAVVHRLLQQQTVAETPEGRRVWRSRTGTDRSGRKGVPMMRPSSGHALSSRHTCRDGGWSPAEASRRARNSSTNPPTKK